MKKPTTTLLVAVVGLGLLASACAADATTSTADPAAAATTEEDTAMGAMGATEPTAGEGALAVAALDQQDRVGTEQGIVVRLGGVGHASPSAICSQPSISL